MKKYLITDITIMSVDEKITAYDPYDIYGGDSRSIKETYKVDKRKTHRVENTMVKLEEFYHSDGREIIIGMTKEVEEFIGLPLMIYQQLSRENQNLIKENSQLEKQKQFLITKSGELRREISSFWGYIKYRWGNFKSYCHSIGE